MIKRLLSVGAICFLALTSMAQTKKTTLVAQVNGYRHDMIYFDCTQTPFIRAEFHMNPGEEHTYSFETDKAVNMLINGRTNILLQPGDSLHVVMEYEGKPVTSMQFGGTPNAVQANQLIWNLELFKRSIRYKSQLLACAALDVKPQNRVNDSRTLLAKANELVNKAGDALTPEAKSYILADVESDVYNSFMEYPMMYAEIRHLPIEKQEIGDYWKLMDNYQLRTDKNALRNPKYISLLMRYCAFQSEKKALEEGKKYVRPNTLESMYKDFASFYEGDVRDAVLYTLLCNFIRNGKEIERAEPILKEYKEKYNIDKEYVQILDTLMQ